MKSTDTNGVPWSYCVNDKHSHDFKKKSILFTEYEKLVLKKAHNNLYSSENLVPNQELHVTLPTTSYIHAIKFKFKKKSNISFI